MFEQYVGNKSFPNTQMHVHTDMMPARFACHTSVAESAGSQVEGILESREY